MRSTTIAVFFATSMAVQLCGQNAPNSTEFFVKARVNFYATQYTLFGNYDNGDHYHSGPSSGYWINSVNDKQLRNCAPLISGGIYKIHKKWFGFYTGITGAYYKQTYRYASHNVYNVTLDSSRNFHYDEYDDIGTGKVDNYILRTEFTPVIIARKTRILLPLINLDIVFSYPQMDLDARRQYYQMITPSASSTNPYMWADNPVGSPQNVAISLAKNSFTYPDPNDYLSPYQPQVARRTPFIYWPLSFRIEQELNLAKKKWIIGAGAIYSPRAHYYGFSFYLGYCIWSKEKGM